MKSGKSKTTTLGSWDYYKLVDYADAHIMKSLITEGGKGFHGAVWSMLDLAIQWNRERPK